MHTRVWNLVITQWQANKKDWDQHAGKVPDYVDPNEVVWDDRLP
jgi:hypothetical protein